MLPLQWWAESAPPGCNRVKVSQNLGATSVAPVAPVVTSLDKYLAGLSSLGVPGVPWHTLILADQLTLFQPGGTDYAHLITTGTPGFSDLPTAMK